MPPGERNTFKPGNNANPSGRPPKTAEMREADELLRKNPLVFARRLIKIAEEGTDKDALGAIREAHDRIYGKAPQSVSLSGADGESLLPQFSFASMSDADALQFLRLVRIARSGPADPAGIGDAGGATDGGDSSAPSSQGPREPR